MNLIALNINWNKINLTRKVKSNHSKHYRRWKVKSKSYKVKIMLLHVLLMRLRLKSSNWKKSWNYHPKRSDSLRWGKETTKVIKQGWQKLVSKRKGDLKICKGSLTIYAIGMKSKLGQLAKWYRRNSSSF